MCVPTLHRECDRCMTGFRENGLIAGLVNIVFFPEKASTISSSAYAKYERFT